MTREDMQRSALEVHLTHPIGFDEERIASTLTIRDRSSNKTVAVIELTPRDFHALMSGRSRGDIEGVAYLALPRDLAKLRHKRVVVSRVLTELPAEVTDEKLRVWVDEAAFFLGSDEARIKRSNQGTTTVELLFYVAPGQDESETATWVERKKSHFASLNLRTLGVES